MSDRDWLFVFMHELVHQLGEDYFQQMQSARYGGYIPWWVHLRHPWRAKYLRMLQREYRREHA